MENSTSTIGLTSQYPRREDRNGSEERSDVDHSGSRLKKERPGRKQQGKSSSIAKASQRCSLCQRAGGLHPVPTTAAASTMMTVTDQ